MDGYSVTKELNEAVDIAMQVAVQKDKCKSVDDYARKCLLINLTSLWIWYNSIRHESQHEQY
jgi:hypothetical protein